MINDEVSNEKREGIRMKKRWLALVFKPHKTLLGRVFSQTFRIKQFCRSLSNHEPIVISTLSHCNVYPRKNKTDIQLYLCLHIITTHTRLHCTIFVVPTFTLIFSASCRYMLVNRHVTVEVVQGGEWVPHRIPRGHDPHEKRRISQTRGSSQTLEDQEVVGLFVCLQN